MRWNTWLFRLYLFAGLPVAALPAAWNVFSTDVQTWCIFGGLLLHVVGLWPILHNAVRQLEEDASKSQSQRSDATAVEVEASETSKTSEWDRYLYYKHLLGLGVYLVGATTVGIAALAGLLVTGRLQLLAAQPPEQHSVGVIVLMSSLLALLGALFYVCNAIRKKSERKKPDEPFDIGWFWAGIFLRVGEALIFTLVLFLLFSMQNSPDYRMLLLTSLLIGMFIKTGERVIFGIAQRVFAAVETLVPTSAPERPARQSPVQPTPSTTSESEAGSPTRRRGRSRRT